MLNLSVFRTLTLLYPLRGCERVLDGGVHLRLGSSEHAELRFTLAELRSHLSSSVRCVDWTEPGSKAAVAAVARVKKRARGE